MKPETGMLTAIYQDPLSRSDYEGLAILVNPVKLDHYDSKLSIWLVEFVGEEGELYQRCVNSDDLILEYKPI